MIYNPDGSIKETKNWDEYGEGYIAKEQIYDPE
jgi:hypothetical protein